MGHFASDLQNNFQIFLQRILHTSMSSKSNNLPYFLFYFISCLTYGDDNNDVELLHENDPVTRRDIRVEVYKHQHVITTMPEDFLYYYISFVFMIVFYFISVLFLFVMFDFFSMSCLIFRVFFTYFYF
jgi:hypothetical protein